MKTIEAIYQQYEVGELSGQEAIEALVSHLVAVQDKLEPLTATEKIIRMYLSYIVERQPKSTFELSGYGKLAIRSATITKSYDSKALDSLIMQLIQEGQAELAQAVALCKKESARSGGLVITKEKEVGE